LGFLNTSLFSSLSEKSRTRKLEILNASFPFDEKTRVLDVGGQVQGAQGQFINQYPHLENVTVVNIRDEHLVAIREEYPQITTRVADARKLPFDDDEFDIVYSNAVIEHVGGWEDQVAMAREVSRVAKNWFVTTPNRWFPFEFHLRLPFVSWLPAPLLLKAASIYSYDHGQKRYRSGLEQHLRLISRRELAKLFPGSQIHALKITVAPETLVAVGGESIELNLGSG
jgi:2-polyprenyl-3-methyl-5-hydroxy-6-metoxy-1,4-benzoquinol methylase